MISSSVVLEAVLEWARAELEADRCAIDLNAVDRALGQENRPPLAERIRSRSRAQAELTRACKSADEAESKMRELSRAYVEQVDSPPEPANAPSQEEPT